MNLGQEAIWIGGKVGAHLGERSERCGVWASEASGGGVLASEASGGGEVLPSEARLPPVGLASSRRRRRIASPCINIFTRNSYRNYKFSDMTNYNVNCWNTKDYKVRLIIDVNYDF